MSGRAAGVPWVAIALAACWLVAGCGAVATISNGPLPIRHVVCTSTAGICSESTMRTEPRVMYLSADGSLYAVSITWAHWGTATATGKGTAEANDCRPNCAEGTFHGHPATITVSDPKGWHRMLAYTRVSVSVPAIGYSYAFTSGLIPSAVPSITPLPSQLSPSPSPSSAALLSTTCILGFDNNGTFEADTAANWNAYGSYSGEEVTATNVGQVGATLNGFETETTWRGQVIDTHDIYSIDAPNLPEFLTPGQTYSLLIDFSSLGAGVSVTESTYLQSECTVVNWYGP
jgi:hypothetical protein